MADIRKLIETSALSNTVKRTALSIFTLLAEAEARVHGTTSEEVHFHEVGAVDSIIDIAGAAICLEMLRVDTVFTGPVELGSGTVTCQHGTMPMRPLHPPEPPTLPPWRSPSPLRWQAVLPQPAMGSATARDFPYRIFYG